jgi:hypothetical protein
MMAWRPTQRPQRWGSRHDNERSPSPAGHSLPSAGRSRRPFRFPLLVPRRKRRQPNHTNRNALMHWLDRRDPAADGRLPNFSRSIYVLGD